MNNSYNFESKLKAAKPEIQEFIKTLKSENLKLKKQIGKLEAEKLSLQNDIILLKEENDRNVKHHEELQGMAPQELIDRINIQASIRKNQKRKKKNT